MKGNELKREYGQNMGCQVAYVYDSPNNRNQYSEGLFDDIDDDLEFEELSHNDCPIQSQVAEENWKQFDDNFIFKTDTKVFKAHKDYTNIYLFFYW